MEENKREEVKKMLLTPICCINTNVFHIFLKDGIVYSSQKYVTDSGNISLDEDMSDFAVGFYEIIYKDILEENTILHKSGKLRSKEFAGDTINSFTNFANRVEEAGKSRRQRTPIECWSSWLHAYYKNYHCLGNFWLLPYEQGRKGRKGNGYDSIEIYLSRYKEKEGEKQYERLCNTHFFEKNIQNESKVKANYKKKEIRTLLNRAESFIENRAIAISESKYAEDLWNYFHKLNLLS